MWSWDWTQSFSWPGFIWGIATAVVLPAAAIIFAVWIGNRQVRATVAAQLEVLKREEQRDLARDEQRNRDRLAEGAEMGIEAMGHLLAATYMLDMFAATQSRLRAAQLTALIPARLGEGNEAVWVWMVRELAVVSAGLEDRTPTTLPRHGTEIGWRSAAFNQAIVNWQMGKTGAYWFEAAHEAGHPPIADTKMPGPTD